MSTCLLVTTMNRTPQLERSLQRLSELTLPDEILVVDDGGDDGCKELCERMSATLPIRYLYNHNPGYSICSFARNVGIRNTDAEIIVTSEPEVLFLTDALPQLLDGHAKQPSKVISAGSVYHAKSEHMTTREQCELIVGWVAPFTALYKRDWLLEVGGWDEAFPGSWGWDDTDLLSRLRFSGYGQVIDLSIEILHQWHTRNSEGEQNQAANEAHFFDKAFHNGELTDLIANKDREWGRTLTRTS